MITISETKESLKGAISWLEKEFSQLHTGRATPLLLDSVFVDSYGSKMPIKNVASVTVEDARTLRIAPWDKNQIKDIERAIAAANLGLSVSVDDAGLRAHFPMLTTENRQRLVKILKEKLEESRISVRKIREGIMDDVKKAEKEGGISEDERFKMAEDVQKCVDETNNSLEALFNKKEEEVMNQ